MPTFSPTPHIFSVLFIISIHQQDALVALMCVPNPWGCFLTSALGGLLSHLSVPGPCPCSPCLASLSCPLHSLGFLRQGDRSGVSFPSLHCELQSSGFWVPGRGTREPLLSLVGIREGVRVPCTCGWVSMAQEHEVPLFPTGPGRARPPALPVVGQGGVGSALLQLRAALTPPTPPQQLPDLPPHLPPAQPPRRPYQARPLQRHLWQPRPRDCHAQLPWEACQGHEDHSKSWGCQAGSSPVWICQASLGTS